MEKPHIPRPRHLDQAAAAPILKRALHPQQPEGKKSTKPAPRKAVTFQLPNDDNDDLDGGEATEFGGANLNPAEEITETDEEALALADACAGAYAHLLRTSSKYGMILQRQREQDAQGIDWQNTGAANEGMLNTASD
jgi:hypothetical protein